MFILTMEVFSKTIITLIITLLVIQINSQQTCPKYSCTDLEKSNECANTKPNSQKFNDVILSDNCGLNEFCDIPLPPWKTLSTETKDTSYTCKTQQKRFTTRYPGEDCESDENCFRFRHHTGRCNNGKCIGISEGFSCSNSFECLKGLYCDSEFNKCVKQKPFGATCSASIECENKHLCHQNLCGLTPFSAEIGEVIRYKRDKFDYAKCKFGLTDGQYRCSQMVQKEPSEGEYTKCNFGDMCTYNFSTEQSSTITKECECGYNSTGQGYCPRGHDKSNYYFN
jgi:hypothetical protein